MLLSVYLLCVVGFGCNRLPVVLLVLKVMFIRVLFNSFVLMFVSIPAYVNVDQFFSFYLLLFFSMLLVL
jgi:hypothetical protein